MTSPKKVNISIAPTLITVNGCWSFVMVVIPKRFTTKAIVVRTTLVQMGEIWGNTEEMYCPSALAVTPRLRNIGSHQREYTPPANGPKVRVVKV